MADTIKIYNPKDIPFGQLSNNYRHQMKINNKEWFYVTSYIYANMLKNITYIEKVREAKVKDIQNLYKAFDNEELKTSVLKAISEALKVKFENKELKQLLVSTGNHRIVYANNNTFLGIGMANDGQNYYGKMLMQARHNIITSNQAEKRKIAQQERQKILKDIYLADLGLTAAVLAGNNLEDYMNLSPTQIVDELGRDELMKKLPSNIDFNAPFLTKFLDNPDNLVPQIRKNYIERYRLIKIRERNRIVFDMYADYLLERYYENLQPEQYEEAKRQQFNTKNLEGSQQKLYDLYKEGMLSESLSASIDRRLADFIVPTKEVVKQILSEPIVYTNKPPIDEIPYVEPIDPPVIVYPEIYDGMDIALTPYVNFAPDTFVELLNINNLVYPNVSLYIINSQLARLENVGSLQEGYKYLLVAPDEPLGNIGPNNFVTEIAANNTYDKLYTENYVNKLQKNTEIALNEKFKDRELQDVLLITGDADLIWDDFNDPILGSGPKKIKGQNYVGFYLMELRQKVVDERQGETIDVLSTEQITNFLSKDSFMKRWLEMRVEDMCKINIIMKDYLWKKDQSNTQLASPIVRQVIDKIYQPCSHVYAATNKVSAEVPPYFEKMVRKCNGFNQVPPETIQLIWQRIVVMIYYLMEHMQASSIQNIRATLAQLELMVSEPATCEPIIPDDDFENCIASALINILVGIKNFNDNISYMEEITKLEIDTAISIIIGKDITKVKEKKQSDQPTIDPEQKKLEQIAQELVPDIEEGSEDELELELIKELGLDQPQRRQLPPSRRNRQPSQIPVETHSVLPSTYVDSSQEQDETDSEEDFEESGVKQEPEEDFYIPSDYELASSDDDYSPKANNIKQKLRTLGLVSEPNLEYIAQDIENAIYTIKLRKMSIKVKQNRVNFFATQR